MTEILRIASEEQDINNEIRLSVLLSRIEAYLQVRTFFVSRSFTPAS